MSVAIVGAGMAGLSCATAVAAQGVSVRLFDKGRGPGGRMATRRAEVGGQTLRFDHGAQYFTARDERFQRAVTEWEDAGAVAAWPAAGEGTYVGTPGMNGPIKAMAEALDVQWATRIEQVERSGDKWMLSSADAGFEATSLVVAVPAEQAAPLCEKVAPGFAHRAASTSSAPCWAVMAAFAEPLSLAVTFKGQGAVRWAARNAAKPGRGGSETWVIHASPEWSAEHLERDADEVAPELLEAFFAATRSARAEPIHLAAHRWRYAMAQPVEGSPALWSPDMQLGMAGDWLLAPRVESAWISGRDLADRMLADPAFMETA